MQCILQLGGVYLLFGVHSINAVVLTRKYPSKPSLVANDQACSFKVQVCIHPSLWNSAGLSAVYPPRRSVFELATTVDTAPLPIDRDQDQRAEQTVPVLLEDRRQGGAQRLQQAPTAAIALGCAGLGA